MFIAGLSAVGFLLGIVNLKKKPNKEDFEFPFIFNQIFSVVTFALGIIGVTGCQLSYAAGWFTMGLQGFGVCFVLSIINENWLQQVRLPRTPK